jgi:hypothetical protein
MPLAAEKTDPTNDHVDPFAWDPDPQVLVARRGRILYFPSVLAQRALKDAEVAALRKRQADAALMVDPQFAVRPGVNFLGTWCTSWADLRTTPGHASKGPNPSAPLGLLEPYCKARHLIDVPANKDPATGRLLPTKAREAFHRILDHHRTEHKDGVAGALDPWTARNGFDGPDLAVLRLSEIFSQRTEAGQQAHAAILSAIPHLRRTTLDMEHIGALHDYAVRHPGGRAILEACRIWAQRKKLSAA